MLAFRFITLLVLGTIAWEDLRERSIHWWLLPVLAIAMLVPAWVELPMWELGAQMGFNLLFLGMQLGGLLLFVVLRNRGWVDPVNRYIGSGDLYFFLVLALANPVANFEDREPVSSVVAIVVDRSPSQMSADRTARTDAAPPATIEVAMAKARCAATFRRPTQVFEHRSVSGEPGVVTLPGVVALAGGVPIVVDGGVIGAIGVSGSAPAIDHEVGSAVIGRVVSGS